MRHKHANKVDMTFRYTPAAKTDVRKTFKRERARIAAERVAVVTPINKRKRSK